MIIWFTGLSGVGKSTIAEGLALRMGEDGVTAILIDGEGQREELCRELGFSDGDRA